MDGPMDGPMDPWLMCMYRDVKLSLIPIAVEDLNPRPAGVWIVTRPGPGFTK